MNEHSSTSSTQVEDRERHLDFMDHPLKWDRHPVLPVKRPGSFDVGIMVPGSANVYRVNLFLLDAGPLGPQLEGVDVDVYASPGHAYDDGWRVD